MKSYNPKAYESNGSTVISGVENFDLEQTLDCGQAFRWKKVTDTVWEGIALGRYLKIGHENGEITLFGTSLSEYEEKWKQYFDIDRNYAEVIERLSQNEILKKAAEDNSGIRILRQDSWEALCSFIISQNNNIPRIKGIIERLCQSFGDKIEGGYTFPTAEKIAVLKPEDLSPLKAGFRARYIIDGALKYSTGQIDLKLIETADTDLARDELLKITGVGNKVADCTLLFGFGRIDALPKDVWIKRALNDYFDGALPECAEGYAGIAQQYLFNYIRFSNNKKVL